jgi:SAM-dependent methyltransferase
MTHDFHTITETPKVRASQEQLSMLYTRYRFAATWCRGKDVLEVACGAGLGLGYLSKVANHVIGGDLDEKNFRIARTCYHTSDNIDVQQFDAHALPFDENSLDVILLYEAIYY